VVGGLNNIKRACKILTKLEKIDFSNKYFSNKNGKIYILCRRPHNPADVYYRQTRPDIYNNIGMVNENGEKWKEMRNQVFYQINHLIFK
jgi:hypothetical protein